MAVADRIEELEDFIQALDEWGVEDRGERVAAITDFLNSPIGLTQYLDRISPTISGRA